MLFRAYDQYFRLNYADFLVSFHKFNAFFEPARLHESVVVQEGYVSAVGISFHCSYVVEAEGPTSFSKWTTSANGKRL